MKAKLTHASADENYTYEGYIFHPPVKLNESEYASLVFRSRENSAGILGAIVGEKDCMEMTIHDITMKQVDSAVYVDKTPAEIVTGWGYKL